MRTQSLRYWGTFIFILNFLYISAEDLYDEICSKIILSDPAFISEKLRLESEIESLKSENRLENPDFDFSYKWGTNVPENKWEISVSQSFEWPGVYSARRNFIKNRGIEYSYAYETYRKERLLQIRLALIDYVEAKRKLEFYQTYAENTSSIYKFSQTAFDTEAITILDFRKIKIENQLSVTRVLEAKAEMINARKKFEILFGGEVSDLEKLTDYPNFSFNEFDSTHIAAYQTLQSAARAADAEYEVARKKMFPGFSLGYVHETEGSAHYNGLRVGISIPLWKSRSDALAKKLLAQSAYENAKADLRQIEAKYISDINLSMTYSAQAEALMYSLGDEKEYIALLDKALEGGTIRVFEYFIELNNILETRLTIETLRASAARYAEEARKYSL